MALITHGALQANTNTHKAHANTEINTLKQGEKIYIVSNVYWHAENKILKNVTIKLNYDNESLSTVNA